MASDRDLGVLRVRVQSIPLMATVRERLLVQLGGTGSGNFGHSGRPGEQGGSGPGDDDDTPYVAESLEESGRKAQAENRARQRNTARIINTLPDGTTVKIGRTDWTKTPVKGEPDPFWESAKGLKTSEQMADDISQFVKAGLIARDVVLEHFPHHERLLPKKAASAPVNPYGPGGRQEAKTRRMQRQTIRTQKARFRRGLP